MKRRRTRRLSLALAAGGLAAAAFAQVPAPVAADPAPTHWNRPHASLHFTPLINEGLATDGDGVLQPRGWLSMRPELVAAGWTHVGDQDIRGGYTYDVYEDLDAGRKLFTVTAPSGRYARYYHRLDAGEKANNSFVTVDPTGKYLVGGEWRVQRRLLVFADPKGRRSGSSLPTAGEIRLDRALENVQSCDFVTARRLACAVDEPVNRVVSVTLLAPVGSAPVVDASVTDEFAIPRRSACAGSYEAEGIDYDVRRRILSVAMIDPSPCFVGTRLFRYGSR